MHRQPNQQRPVARGGGLDRPQLDVILRASGWTNRRLERSAQSARGEKDLIGYRRPGRALSAALFEPAGDPSYRAEVARRTELKLANFRAFRVA